MLTSKNKAEAVPGLEGWTSQRGHQNRRSRKEEGCAGDFEGQLHNTVFLNCWFPGHGTRQVHLKDITEKLINECIRSTIAKRTASSTFSSIRDGSQKLSLA